MNRQDKLAIIIFAIVASVVMVVLGVQWLVQASLPEHNEQTLCLADRKLAAHTVILVDRTDPITEAQSVSLRQEILRQKDRLAQFELMTIISIASRATAVPDPLFELCNPGTGDMANPWYQNPDMIQDDYEKRFGAPLDRVIEGLMVGNIAPQSPIIETIERVAKLENFSAAVGSRRLVVFSDLLQNSDGYTQYRVQPTVADLDAPYVRDHLPGLRDVEVTVVYIQREKSELLQTEEHVSFWRGFFERAGARVMPFQYR